MFEKKTRIQRIQVFFLFIGYRTISNRFDILHIMIDILSSIELV